VIKQVCVVCRIVAETNLNWRINASKDEKNTDERVPCINISVVLNRNDVFMIASFINLPKSFTTGKSAYKFIIIFLLKLDVLLAFLHFLVKVEEVIGVLNNLSCFLRYLVLMGVKPCI
jgi:hypothetical protein